MGSKCLLCTMYIHEFRHPVLTRREGTGGMQYIDVNVIIVAVVSGHILGLLAA